MDRVNIPGEKPGSATYYMGMAPEEHGSRIYEMEFYGDATIRSAMMDIGKDPTEVWDQTQKNHMAEFFNILAEPDYYEVKELERIEEELQISIKKTAGEEIKMFITEINITDFFIYLSSSYFATAVSCSSSNPKSLFT